MNAALRLGAVWGLALVTLALSIFQIHNDDAGFHVANGQWILEHGTIPLHNPFSFAEDGADWIQHQWLSATWMASVAESWGAKGLILWKAALVFVTFLVLMWACRQHTLPWVLGLGMSAIGASAYRFVERPYLVTMLFLAITGVALGRWRESPRQLKWAWLASLATVVSIHFHAGGLYCLLIWGAFLADGLFPSTNEGIAEKWKGGKQFLVWFLGVVLATVLTLALFAPSGLQVLLLPFGFSHHAYWNEHLGEFRPLPLHVDALPQWTLIALSGFGGAWALRKRSVFQGLVLLGFGFLAVKHARMIYPLAVVFLAMASSIAIPQRFRKKGGLLVLGVGLVSLISGASSHMDRVTMGWGEDGFDRRKHPIELMDLAKKMPGETFVSDGLAGTWLWQVYNSAAPSAQQQRRVLVHNCLECYEERTYQDLYQWIRYGKEGWEDKVDALGIQSFLLKHTTPGSRRMQQGKPNVRQHLFQSSRWHLVEFNDVASLYVREDVLPDGLTSLDGGTEPFPVDPDSWRPRASDTPWPALKTALLQHSQEQPTTVRSLLILGQLASQIGDISTLGETAKEVIKRRPDGPEAKSLRSMLERLTQS